MIGKHFNHEYDSGDGFPHNVGDRYYSQDMGRDYHYLMDRIGLLAKDLFGDSPFIVSGGLVTKGASNNEINITACVGYVGFEVDVPLSFAALPPTFTQEEIDLIRVVSTAQVNLNISGTATLDGSTTNYVKLNYAELDGATRSRAKKAGTYAYDQSPSFAIVVDTVAPTSEDIVLMAFKWDGLVASVLEDVTGNRSPELIDLLTFKEKSEQNDIINGSFNVWQREITFPSIATGIYSADRWVYIKVGAMVHDIDRDTDVPDSEVNYSIKLDCTTIDASIDAADYVGIEQIVEGYNITKYVGNFATISFWVKATKPGTYCLSLRNSGNDRSYVAEYQINAASTWEYKEITIEFNYSGGTWDFTNGTGLRVFWALAAGSTFQTTPGAWQTGNFLGTANQVNGVDNAANDFFLAKVKMELGQVATPFVTKPITQEREDCQRYYAKSYNPGVFPGAIDGNGRVRFFSSGGGNVTAIPCSWPVYMRAAPTGRVYSHVTGTAGQVRNASADQPGTLGDLSAYGGQVANSGTANTALAAHFTVDAELT